MSGKYDAKLEPLYVWKMRDVPGEVLRMFAWWLREFRWPWARRRALKAWGLRYRTSRWLLCVTDDRRWTLDHMTPAQMFWRKRLGRREREWILVDNDEADQGTSE